MDKQTGWTANSKQGLIVLALLLVAIVAGQAEGNLPPEATAAGSLEGSSSTHLILSIEQIERMEKLPQVLERVLFAPKRLDDSIDLLTERNDAQHTDDAADSALRR